MILGVVFFGLLCAVAGFFAGRYSKPKTVSPLALYANMQVQAARLQEEGRILDASELRASADKMLEASSTSHRALNR